MPSRLIQTIEAAYRVSLDEEQWLQNLAETVLPLANGGLGLGAMLYDASEPAAPLRIKRLMMIGTPRGFDAPTLQQAMQLVDDPRYLDQTFRGRRCATMSETLTSASTWTRSAVFSNVLASFGIRDVLGINGLDCDQVGCFLGFFLPTARRLTPRVRATWNQVSVHVAAAYRLRRRLAVLPRPEDLVAGAEAVLDASGRAVHAEGAASPRHARTALREGALARARARGPLRERNPESAIAEWKGLIAARWTLVDHFERDGQHYLIARKNDPSVPRLERLSERERQVVALTRLGLDNQLIAYELGLTAATVRALLARALGKLGFKSREMLMRKLGAPDPKSS